MEIIFKDDPESIRGYSEKMGVCACGQKHDLMHTFSDFTCHKCGRFYNAGGQELESFTGNGDDEYWSEDEKW